MALCSYSTLCPQWHAVTGACLLVRLSTGLWGQTSLVERKGWEQEAFNAC